MIVKYFFVAALLYSFIAFAQQTEVPESISSAFSKLYPQVTEVTWDKEGNDFEASFSQDDKDMSVLFDDDGEVLETETAIETSMLPEGVETYIAEHFTGYKISGAAKIIKANGEELFEAEINNGKNIKDIYFDSEGKPEKNDVNNEDEED